MSSWTWVCFDCRRTVRRSMAGNKAVRCPECAGECTSIGYKIRVPVRRDKKAWAKLQKNLLLIRRGVVVNPLRRLIEERQARRNGELELEHRLKRRDRAWLLRYLKEKETGEA